MDCARIPWLTAPVVEIAPLFVTVIAPMLPSFRRSPRPEEDAERAAAAATATEMAWARMPCAPIPAVAIVPPLVTVTVPVAPPLPPPEPLPSPGRSPRRIATGTAHALATIPDAPVPDVLIDEAASTVTLTLPPRRPDHPARKGPRFGWAVPPAPPVPPWEIATIPGPCVTILVEARLTVTSPPSPPLPPLPPAPPPKVPERFPRCRRCRRMLPA